jgi:hypothetical protein
VAELALDQVHRHSLALHLGRVPVVELVRRETPAHTGLGGQAPPLPSGPPPPTTATPRSPSSRQARGAQGGTITGRGASHPSTGARLPVTIGGP